MIRQTSQGQLLIFRDDEATLRESWERFDRENPQVYETLVRLAYEWVGRHPERACGIGMLFEVARWQLNFRTVGEPLKLNNNYRAFYARRIMAEHPLLEDLFETRRQRSEVA